MNNENNNLENSTIVNEAVKNDSVNTFDNQTNMNDANTIKKKSSKLPIIIIIILLLVLLGGIGYFYLFKKKDLKPNEYYISLLDKGKDYALTLVDELEDGYNSAVKVNGKLNINIDSNDTTIVAFKDIINKLEIDFDTNYDFNNKYIGIDLMTKYNAKDLLGVNFTVLENKGFIDLGKLLNNKAIELDITKSEIWNDIDNESLKDYVNIIINALKDNLKEEYFSVNKNVYKLEIKAGEFKKYIESVMKSIEDKIDGIDTESFLANIDENNYLIIESTLNNTNDIEKIVIKDEIDTIELNKTGDKFVINYNKENIGSIAINENYLLLELNSEDANISIKLDERFNKKIYEIGAESVCDQSDEGCEPISIKMNLNEENKQGKLEIKLIAEDLQTNITLTGEYTISENVDPKPEYSNTIKIDSLTENDLNTIIQNIMNNETFIELVSDLGLNGLIEEYQAENILTSACVSAQNNPYNFDNGTYSINCANGTCVYKDLKDSTKTFSKAC